MVRVAPVSGMLFVAGGLLAAGSAMMPITPTARAVGEPGVTVTEYDISGALIRDSGGGSRGPALGLLPDGRALLGGGPDGRTLYLTTPGSGQLINLGAVINPQDRRDDARFGPTDIEVMSTGPGTARLFLSYPQYRAARNCVRVAVDRVDISTGDSPQITGRAKVFRSKPCVTTSGVQQAGGRLVRITDTRAYLSLGDLSSPLIASRSARGQLGTIQQIGLGTGPTRISQGHRNPQGLTRDSAGRLWETEHGPRGGDELNWIRKGRDYGWPFVTLGQPYSANDYVIPRRTGTHSGYTRPRTAWVPSVATSELVEVPGSWPGWSGQVGPDLLMGTLKDESFYRIRLAAGAKVAQTERIPVGHRIRDLDRSANATVIATTDSGQLLVLQPSVP